MHLYRYLLPISLGLSAAAHALDSLPEAANWIANPSFETGSQDCPVDWIYLNQHETTTGAWDSTHAHSGAQGVAVQSRGGLAYGRWITPYQIPFAPGERCRISFWYRGAGAQVYLQGRATELSSNGVYSADLTKYYKSRFGPTPATSEWTYVEAEFNAPSYPSWAQLCLGGNGRDTCEFDDIALARPGLVRLQPTSPVLIRPGETHQLILYADSLRAEAAGSVTWHIQSDHFKLDGVSRDSRQGTWTLDLIATQPGVADITIRATSKAQPPLSLHLPKMARVYGGTGGAFTIAAMTDLHFYRPGQNERNNKFGQLADAVNALDPLFAVSLGDEVEIHSGSRDEEKKFQVAAAQEQLGRLDVPLFHVPGNHEIDKTYEGAGTQWYYEKLMQVTPHFSLEVDGTLIAGVDITAPGLCGREHGASFTRAGQSAWLQTVLGSYTGQLPILCAHVPPYNEFSDSADRNEFLSIIFTNRVRAFLAGHLHYTKDEWVRNPAADAQSGPPWPTPAPLETSAEGTRKLADPDNTVFLTTTTGSAFLLGGYPFNGYRYLLVRDREIVWQDVLPISLSITRRQPDANMVIYQLTNGADKAISGLPLKAELPPGTVTATLGAAPLPTQVTTNDLGHLVVWVQPDIPTNTTLTLTLRSDENND